MVEVCNGLWVCNQEEYNNADFVNCSFCFCAKDPFHKIIVGYKGNLDKLHKEYLYAERPDEHIIALNLIDTVDPKYISKKIIDRALKFIDEEFNKNRGVVLVCNQGKSRSACIALMYMLKKGFFKGYKTFRMVEEAYKEIYPIYDPGNGMRTFTEKYWEEIKESV